MFHQAPRAAALSIGLLASAAALAQSAGADTGLIPSGKFIHHRLHDQQAGGRAPTAGSTGSMTPAIKWNGGPVMAMPNVHLIWYGNWAQSNGSDNATGQDIVRDFVYGANGSSHMALNVGYTGSGGSAVSGYIGTVYEGADAYSRGTRLKDADIATIVSSYITRTGLKDPNAIYFVLTSSDVNETSGFCTKYCGWHTSGTLQSSNIKYSFVGNANRCLSGCAAQTVGPNGNAGVDGMLSVLMHEMEETLTDPNPSTGWADTNGAENGDKCAWTFGASQTKGANGAYYNLTLPARAGGTRNYLIQRNLKTDSKCYVDATGRQ
jgi:hypothetical protein